MGQVRVRTGNVVLSEKVHFPLSVFYVEVSDSRYLKLDLAEPLLLLFPRAEGAQPKGAPYEYGLLAEVQTLERSYSSKVKIQLYARARARLLRYADVEGEAEYIRVREPSVPVKALISSMCLFLQGALDRLAKSKSVQAVALRERLAANLSLFRSSYQREGGAQLTASQSTLAASVLKSHPDRLRYLGLAPLGQHWMLVDHLHRVVEELLVDERLQGEMSRKIGQQQREYLINERIRALQEELNAGKPRKATDFSEKWRKAPKAFQEAVREAIAELSSTPRSSPEYAQQKRLVHYLTSLPWEEGAHSSGAEEVTARLSQSHFGLEEVKESIADYLAAYLRNPGLGKILCLYGAPGIGKTTIASSTAEALGRDFVKISLAGCGDAAYLLGTSRVYVNSQPGAIITSLAKLNRADPVVLLDEIDKTVDRYGARGGNAVEYALIEILDRATNASFKDHFVEEPYSLAKVFWICTANSIEDIPVPLLDRLELIALNPYSLAEKIEIARRWLVPSIAKGYSLGGAFTSLFTEEALTRLIRRYTHEAGVRALRSRIEKLAMRFIRGKFSGPLTGELLDELLRDKIVYYDTGTSSPRFNMPVGRALGMVVRSEVGGGVMPVDVKFLSLAKKPGAELPSLEATGLASQTMRESARNALVAVAGLIESLPAGEAREALLKKLRGYGQLHVNFASTGVPKDGPSAGLATALAILSSLTERPLPYWSYTGEVTPQGEVTIIGGVKEKLMGAVENGIAASLLPGANRPEWEMARMSEPKVHFVENIAEAASLA